MPWLSPKNPKKRQGCKEAEIDAASIRYYVNTNQWWRFDALIALFNKNSPYASCHVVLSLRFINWDHKAMTVNNICRFRQCEWLNGACLSTDFKNFIMSPRIVKKSWGFQRFTKICPVPESSWQSFRTPGKSDAKNFFLELPKAEKQRNGSL